MSIVHLRQIDVSHVPDDMQLACSRVPLVPAGSTRLKIQHANMVRKYIGDAGFDDAMDLKQDQTQEKRVSWETWIRDQRPVRQS